MTFAFYGVASALPPTARLGQREFPTVLAHSPPSSPSARGENMERPPAFNGWTLGEWLVAAVALGVCLVIALIPL